MKTLKSKIQAVAMLVVTLSLAAMSVHAGGVGSDGSCSVCI